MTRLVMTRLALSARPALRLAPLALCGLAGVAAAQAPPPRSITPPAGWARQPVQVAAPRPDVTATSVEVFYPPPAPGATGPRPAVLYVTRIERPAAADRRDAIASAELEEIFAAQRRQGPGAQTEASTRRADPAARQLEASLTWRDASIGMVDASRVVVAADAGRVVAITGQCLLAAGAPAELASACDAALATLEPGVPAAARVPLAMAAEPASVAGPAGPAAPAAPAPPAASGEPAAMTAPGASGPGPGPAPARLDDASRVELPQPPPPPARAADRRPLYLGVGIVVIALMFWWNRRRRERFEADDQAGGKPARAPAGEPDRAPADDDDDDGLHAAADPPKREPKPEEEKDA